MVTRGVMATMATMPKASVIRSPPPAEQAPMAKGSRKVAVMGLSSQVSHKLALRRQRVRLERVEDSVVYFDL